MDNLKRARSLVGISAGRPSDDYYPTPFYATRALLEYEKFDGLVWEPACGDGAICKILDEYGYEYIASDLNYRDFGEGSIDFLKIDRVVDNIITNPPYNIAQEFVEHSLKSTTKKVAMLCKLQFLEGVKRRDMFKTTPLKTVYVFSKRLTMGRNGDASYKSGMLCFAWFVWDHSYEGKPVIEWI